LDSNTGERLRRIRDHIAPNEDFCFTYGDGLSDVNIKELIEFHSNHKKLVSMTVIRPLSRYGSVELKGNSVTQFQEKPESQSFVNGGFFILNEQVFSLICPENPSWENDLLPLLVRQSEVHAYKHLGFWQSMDTLRDKNLLEQMWNSGNPPWKSWND
jgi:glucose-1-phosphate cytidylyltransferase